MTPAPSEKRDATKRSGSLTAGLILVGLGAVFLLRSHGWLRGTGLWPWILIVVGLSLLLTYLIESKR